MFTSGISEKVIADTSGHKSMNALRCYECKSEQQQQQQQQVTAVINNGTDFVNASSTDLDDKCSPLLLKENVEDHLVSMNFSETLTFMHSSYYLAMSLF